jgi:hypothetical protein
MHSFTTFAAALAVALAAESSHAQEDPRRAVGGTVGPGLSGFKATIFGEGDRGYWRGHARVSGVSYAVGCKLGLHPCPDDRSAFAATVGASILSSPVPKVVRAFAGGAVGLARYNVGLDGQAEYWIGSDIGGRFTQLRLQMGGEYSHHPMPFLEVGIRRAF